MKVVSCVLASAVSGSCSFGDCFLAIFGKVAKIEILRKIGRMIQNHKKWNRNTDRKILPKIDNCIHTNIHAYNIT